MTIYHGIKMGDTIAIKRQDKTYLIVTVRNVSKTRITIANGTQFNRRSGIEWGMGDMWGLDQADSIGTERRRIMTKGDAEERNIKILIKISRIDLFNKISQYFYQTSYTSLSLDQLERINSIIEKTK